MTDLDADLATVRESINVCPIRLRAIAGHAALDRIEEQARRAEDGFLMRALQRAKLAEERARRAENPLDEEVKELTVQLAESEESLVYWHRTALEVEEERDESRAQRDSLRLELQASEHNRKKDNEALIAQRDEWRQRVQELERALGEARRQGRES